MKIEQITIRNYKVFQNVSIKDLPPLAVFVGANGTGKSTFFDVFGFLRDALKNNVRQALQKRGGFREVVTRGSKGPIFIELKFMMNVGEKERIVTYALQISEKKGLPVITRETLAYKRGKYGSPFNFLKFSNGEGYAISNEEDFDKDDTELARDYQTLGAPDILAIKGLGQFQKFKAANAFRDFIENWHVSDFHITETRPSQEAGYAEHLSVTGDNLALVAQFLYENHRDIFDEVLARIKYRIPGIQKVEAATTLDGRIILKFQDGSFKDPFIARYVSDGTLKMFAYLVLLFDPNPHPLLCIEEPENQLYPSLLHDLVEEFRDYAGRGGQVFVSSHSPELLNACDIDEVFWLQKRDGITSINRTNQDPLISALVSEGDQLGHIWMQDYFKGANPA